MENFKGPVSAILLISLLGVGCMNRSVEKRISDDIKQLRLASRVPVGPHWLSAMRTRYLLDALTNLDSRDLRKPHLVLPVIAVRSDGAMLAVIWVEDRPSVTGIELIGDNGEVELLQMPLDYILQNTEDSRHSVCFRVTYRWRREEMPPVLKSPCAVRLVAPNASTNAISLIVHEEVGIGDKPLKSIEVIHENQLEQD